MSYTPLTATTQSKTHPPKKLRAAHSQGAHTCSHILALSSFAVHATAQPALSGSGGLPKTVYLPDGKTRLFDIFAPHRPESPTPPYIPCASPVAMQTTARVGKAGAGCPHSANSVPCSRCLSFSSSDSAWWLSALIWARISTQRGNRMPCRKYLTRHPSGCFFVTWCPVAHSAHC